MSVTGQNSPDPRNPIPTIVAWLRDRRVIAIAESDGVVTTGVDAIPGCFAVGDVATLPDLRQIDWVIDINLETTPATNLCLGAPYGKRISGNVVGFTIVGTSGLATGTTVWAEVVAIGPP